ncbi:MFS transporter [Streptomyces spiroverticillatus]|uniref:MFS transporter n=1 Tax=Streptomyces finlayi TaxID=67296 RepID=A0A918X3H6_9ACTN|nr:MFS transporter [Streptomyces finlayi]GHA26998.1 MFS transporter [Streptomyces spiroverticillatus]GHD08290.1 MFS transporter [Streptomyces finlayi]
MAKTSASHTDRVAVASGPATAGVAPRDARLFWCSNTADALGSQTSGVVLPLLLLALGHSPAAVGGVVAASAVLGLVIGPLAAVPADRGARKPVMMGAACVAALAMAVVAVAVATGRPPLALVLAGVLVERFATAVYEAAARGTVALLSPPEGYARTVARLEVGDRLALVLGPVLGGALYQVGRALPFAVDAFSYVVTAVCVRFMRADLRALGPARADDRGAATGGPTGRTPDGPQGAPVAASARPRVSPRAELAAGLRLVADSAVLRLVLLWTSVVNGVLAALYFGVLFTLQRDGHSGTATGAVLAVAGAAGIAGALAAPSLAVRIGAARSVLAVTWLLVPLTGALATTGSPWWQAALFGGICLAMPVATVVLQSRAIAATPVHLQARAGAVLATGAGGAAALGPAAAGLLAGAGAAGPALGCAGALLALAAYTTWARPRSLAPPAAGQPGRSDDGTGGAP